MTILPTTDDVVRALAGRVTRLFGLSVNVEVIRADESFIGAEEMSIGGHEFDSMDLLEILVTIEDELGVTLIDSIDLEQLSTLRAFADHAKTQASPEALGKFVDQWAIEGVRVAREGEA